MVHTLDNWHREHVVPQNIKKPFKGKRNNTVPVKSVLLLKDLHKRRLYIIQSSRISRWKNRSPCDSDAWIWEQSYVTLKWTGVKRTSIATVHGEPGLNKGKLNRLRTYNTRFIRHLVLMRMWSQKRHIWLICIRKYVYKTSVVTEVNAKITKWRRTLCSLLISFLTHLEDNNTKYKTIHDKWKIPCEVSEIKFKVCFKATLN